MATVNIQITSLTTLAEYGCDAYGANAFGECSTTTNPGTNPGTGTGANPGTTPGGGLADTGWNIIIPVALGIALIVASAILLVKRVRRSRKQTNLN